MNQRFTLFIAWMACSLALWMAACGQKDAASVEETTVHSYLEGRLIVSAEIDSVPDYRDFEVLVALNNQGEPDTLGFAVTDSTGGFHLDVTAPDRGLYPLIVSRRGQILGMGELAVAEGDSATLKATFPLGNRSLRFRSLENAAWAAYRNTKAQYNQALVELIRSGQYDERAVANRVAQTTMIFWDIRTTFPNTMGSEVASAEAVLMIGGWNDSLALAWAMEIDPQHLSYAEVGRIARQAQARLAGQAAALQLIGDFQARAVNDQQRAQLQSELVLAHLDSLQHDEALAAARALIDTYPNTDWTDWAARAIYELENLLPGMMAPSFTATTNEGETVVLDSLRGRLVLLEFYVPQDPVFQREVRERNALYEAVGEAALAIVSISAEPDTLLNEAFLEGRDVPGFHVFAPEGLDNRVARSYNINVLPTRYLIDGEGKIVGKYVGGAMATLREDVMVLRGNS
ncbi:MAG: peroxiredoxin family protein [Rhodothermales bacterium]